MTETVEIVEITAVDTRPLRLRVLRTGTPDTEVVWAGDDEATTFHLGALAGGDLVGISTWLLRRYPDRPDVGAFQLRGMATAPGLVGSGIGTALLLAGLDRCAAEGAGLVWARARATALGFYERHGFDTVGPRYTDLTTGLAHHDIVRRLDGSV